MAAITKFLTNSNGKMLVDSTTGKPLSVTIDVVNGLSIRLAERAAVSTAYSTFASYSTTSQTYSNITNASEFAVGDVAILQWTITDRDNTAGIIFAEVSAVSSNSITAKGLGMSVKGDHGDDGAQIELQVADGQLQWKYDYQESWTNLIAISELKGDAGDTPEIGDNGNWFVGGNDTGKPSRGASGTDGATFTPAVDANGNLSWTNDGGLPNPETVNVRGAQGEAATVQVGQVTTLPAGSQATVTNSGTNQAAVLNFGIPTGATGANGITPHIGVDGFWYIGETNTNVKARGQDGEDGVTPHIGENGNWFIGNQDTNVKAEGTDGQDGAASTIEVGEVTTGAAGTQASVTNSGTANAAVLDFTIPKGADGASGVTDVTAGTPTEQDGYTVTPVTFNFERGNSKTVNIQAKNGEDGGEGGGAGVQQNAVINRTASVTTADENSPDFVENNGDLWVKRLLGYETEVTTLKATLPSALYDTSAATAPNGKIYVFGGFGDVGPSDDIIEFDPVTKTVMTLEATLPDRRDGISAATAPNGKIYVFGGSNNTNIRSDDIIEFDPVTKTVMTLEATLPTARYGTSAATAPNGKIYVFGGFHTGSYLDDIVEFDPATETVTTLKATLPSARQNTSAATAPNGKIYVFGGSAGGSYLDDIVEFNPVTQTAIRRIALPSTRYNTSAATAPNGKIYVFGGRSGNTRLDDIVEFDPVRQIATTLEATLPSTRYNTSAATAPNGKIYVFGGDGGPNLDDIIEFDPSAAQYAYSPAVVLSQEEYAQFKNILNGVFSVGISAPSAEISGAVTAGGNVTATGAVTASSFNATT